MLKIEGLKLTPRRVIKDHGIDGIDYVMFARTREPVGQIESRLYVPWGAYSFQRTVQATRQGRQVRLFVRVRFDV